MDSNTTATKISVMDMRKKGQLKDYSAKEMLTVQVQRLIQGFTESDLREIGSEITEMTEKMNSEILKLFILKAEQKKESMELTVKSNQENYDERYGEFNGELDSMNARFDYLKKKELKICDDMEAQIDNKNRKRTLKMCLGVMGKYATECRSRKNVSSVTIGHISDSIFQKV